MIRSYEATPQIFIIGSITKAIHFEEREMFIRYNFIYGSNFTELSGVSKGETFQNSCLPSDDYISFDHPLNLNLKCRSIKGWPKLFIEAWGTDSDGRNNLLGYGVSTIPISNGNVELECSCWRPVGSQFKSYILGITPELKDKSIVYSTEEKFGLETISTGSVIISLDIILKDFEIHGIE